MKHILIIGSGIAGIATSIRLACAGYRVSVLEANAYPGGKLSEVNGNGFRFDAGPSLFTLPHQVDELFTLAGKNPADYFNYIQLEKACCYFFDDGIRFAAYHNQELMAAELKSQLGIADVSPFFNHLKNAQFRYELTAPIFIKHSLHRINSYTKLQTLKGIANAWRIGLWGSMNAENKRVLKSPHLVQYFNRFATYNGSSPYKAPALLNMIPHLEHGIGSFFPVGGMHQITQSLFKLAKELGVSFHFNARVEEIITDKKRTTGAIANGKPIAADYVVSNADVHQTYRRLLPGHKAPEKILKQEKSSSALIFYWGISNTFAQLDLHNVFFSSNYEAEFDCLFNKKTIFADPTVYINITSKYAPADAPAGCENWFVMINVPNNSGQDWDTEIKKAKTYIIKKLSRLLHTEIEPLITYESVLDPRSIEQKTGSFAGALYGNASNNMFAAFLRHKNFSSNIKGLYFCGGSVHPGGGIPLCLNSARIVAQLINEDDA
jgi:phytoene desaturase